MIMRRAILAMVLAGLAGTAAAQQSAPVPPPGSMPPDIAEPAPPTEPAVEPLGGDRYQIGEIVVDKGAGLFTVPGVTLDLGGPQAAVEFLATARGGAKNYESLIEVTANAYEFNLACILIGLTPRPELQPDGHFDPNPIDGSPVAIRVSWTRDGQTVRFSAGRLISAGEGVRVIEAWVYTGSVIEPNGDYRAHVSGALVGVVHDRDSVIHHRSGLALGNYGDVTARVGTIPEAGTPVTLTVMRLDD